MSVGRAVVVAGAGLTAAPSVALQARLAPYVSGPVARAALPLGGGPATIAEPPGGLGPGLELRLGAPAVADALFATLGVGRAELDASVAVAAQTTSTARVLPAAADSAFLYGGLDAGVVERWRWAAEGPCLAHRLAPLLGGAVTVDLAGADTGPALGAVQAGFASIGEAAAVSADVDGGPAAVTARPGPRLLWRLKATAARQTGAAVAVPSARMNAAAPRHVGPKQADLRLHARLVSAAGLVGASLGPALPVLATSPHNERANE